MKRIFRLPCLVLWIALSVGAFSPVLAQNRPSYSEALIVALHSEATVDQSIICLDQIARISGGSAELRRHVGKLDIAELRPGNQQVVVTSENVRFRLLIAGLAPTQFHLVGAKRVAIVELDEPITLRKIIAAAELVVRREYPGDRIGLSMTPLPGTVLPPINVRSTDRVRFEGRIIGAVPIAGKARTEVTIHVNDTPRAIVPVVMVIRAPEIALLPLVAKPQQPSMIRPVAGITPKAEAKELLIKSGDSVKIVAVLGTARLEARGEAMANGALGETIRVRNVESNRVILGRIEAGGFVTVEY